MSFKSKASSTSETNQEAAITLDLLYEQAQDYIARHYNEKGLNASLIAESLGCSTRQLSRAFQGRPETLTVLIRRIRLMVGYNMLQQHPELAVAEVARRLHFYDAKYFKRCYKKQFGHLPRQGS